MLSNNLPVYLFKIFRQLKNTNDNRNWKKNSIIDEDKINKNA